MLAGAPVSYSLADDWSSKMSNGQGGDYLKYHVGQHGGAHMAGADLSAITDSALPAALRGPAHIGSLDRSFADIAGLKDQAGGRRRTRRNRTRRGKKSQKKGGKRSKKSQKKGGKRRSSKRSRRTRRSRGGALGYAAFPSAGMLLDSAGYAKAGLTPEWKAGVEFDAAKMREAL